MPNEALDSYSSLHHIDIILCQEAYVFHGKMIGIPDDWRVSFSSNFTSSIIIVNINYVIIKSVAMDNIFLII